jgi:hypothetical protein
MTMQSSDDHAEESDEGHGRTERIRRRSLKIEGVQEVLAKLSDSLAVLLPNRSPDKITSSDLARKSAREDKLLTIIPEVEEMNEEISSTPPYKGSFKSSVQSILGGNIVVEEKAIVGNSLEREEILETVYSDDGPPRGRILRLVVWSNWGDETSIGLNGVDVYNSMGVLIKVDSVVIEAPTGLSASRVIYIRSHPTCSIMVTDFE